jgi:DNA-binding HxlR family transcriptional regulator
MDGVQGPEYVLEKIGGKWKMPILWRLGQHPLLRYSEIRRGLEGISHKMLSRQLRELERDQLIDRKVYPVVPPKVEYSLTPLGKLALPAISALCDFQAVLPAAPECEDRDMRIADSKS